MKVHAEISKELREFIEKQHQLSQHFKNRDYPGARQIIVADILRVQTSCGFGVPYYEYQGERDLLPKWAEKKGSTGLAAYCQENNRVSIDGMPTRLGTDEKMDEE